MFLDDQTRPVLRPLHISQETIADSWDGRDVVSPVGIFPERFSQQEYILRETTLFDYRVAPDTLHEFVFGNHRTRILDERQQRLKKFWSERHHLLTPQQEPLFEVKAKWPKFVTVIGLGLMVKLAPV